MTNRYTRSINEIHRYNGASLCDLMFNEGTFDQCRGINVNTKGIVRIYYYNSVKPSDDVWTGNVIMDFVDRFCQVLDDGDWIYDVRLTDGCWLVWMTGRKGVDKKDFDGYMALQKTP